MLTQNTLYPQAKGEVSVAVGDWVTFKISGSGGRKLVCRVRRVRRYASFRAMLVDVGVAACLPPAAADGTSQVMDLDAAVATYHAFGTMSGETYAELEQRAGAIAIDVEPLA